MRYNLYFHCSENTAFYIFTPVKYSFLKICIIFHQYFSVFHYFVYDKCLHLNRNLLNNCPAFKGASPGMYQVCTRSHGTPPPLHPPLPPPQKKKKTLQNYRNNNSFNTVKSVLSSRSKRRPKVVFSDRFLLNEGQKFCRMFQWEHSAILSTFIKLPFIIKIFVLPILEWPLKTGVTVC